MRRTLRRSCAACAKSKHSCDLRTPRCSRCVKRSLRCAYANEPLSGQGSDERVSPIELNFFDSSVDPFDSHPPTRLPKQHVQRFMYQFLNKIAFQYYPLDLDASSNPFIISWWPLALGDPALFHVSLQTACLDEELHARNGFQMSELLMADSITLLQRKVGSMSLALQDGTLNSVITLATIEYGKGNVQACQMHVDGVKRLVNLRGGISSVRQTSPLTARMISWVAMIVMGKPQFDTQDDFGSGQGVPSIPAWRMDSAPIANGLSELGIQSCDIEFEVFNVLVRLRNIFQQSQDILLPPTTLHDLASFALHRLLRDRPDVHPSPINEQLRHATALYMFIVQGPTYFQHTFIANEVASRLMVVLRQLDGEPGSRESLNIWSALIGAVSSTDPDVHMWFSRRVNATAQALQITNWEDAMLHCKSILWLEKPVVDAVFCAHWKMCMNTTYHLHRSTVQTAESASLAAGTRPQEPCLDGYTKRDGTL